MITEMTFNVEMLSGLRRREPQRLSRREIYLGELSEALSTSERVGILTLWHQLPMNYPL